MATAMFWIEHSGYLSDDDCSIKIRSTNPLSRQGGKVPKNYLVFEITVNEDNVVEKIRNLTCLDQSGQPETVSRMCFQTCREEAGRKFLRLEEPLPDELTQYITS